MDVSYVDLFSGRRKVMEAVNTCTNIDAFNNVLNPLPPVAGVCSFLVNSERGRVSTRSESSMMFLIFLHFGL